MPAKKGIVKSGNAGNSSKPAKSDPSSPAPDAIKRLFPPGFKYPLSLLHETCQKKGWEKPVINTIRRGNEGYSFVVTLARINKKTSERELVRLSPLQSYCRPSASEAQHWGATYALYRFCNSLQLNRTLPPGPREYWNELVAEHKAAPEHQRWMYNADPFAGLQEVKERQAEAAQKQGVERNQTERNPGPPSGPYSNSPEVKMASSLRVEVEEAIKEGFAFYGCSTVSSVDEEALSAISKQLETLGFAGAQVKKATLFLSQPSPLLGKLLGTLSPHEVATEYLLLHTPECDLPARFLPTVNSSNPFISSAHSGTSDVKKRWIEDKAVKEAGWPIHIVQEYTTNPAMPNDWPMLVTTLGKRLLGIQNNGEEPRTTPFDLDEDELQSLGAELQDAGHFALPSFTAPLTLHILFDASQHYPRPYYSPMFITSDKVPPYVRLHILSRILSSLYSISDIERLEHSFGTTLMAIMDEEWAHIEDKGPPDISDVMAHMLPERKARLDVPTIEVEKQITSRKRAEQGTRRNAGGQEGQKIPATITEGRKRLPAYQARADFLNSLSKNRVVVVVGETGSGKTTQLPQYILESAGESQQSAQYPYIIVTQPRRISAISVANRVSEERGDDGTVGYAVRGKSKQGKQTRLLFCTTGVILRRLGSGDKLRDVSHVIVDEVHERSLDGDFLLFALKQLLWSHSTLKIILMSATINHEVFARYFDRAPVLSIPGITHPVTDKYLEEIIPAIDYDPTYLGQSNMVDKKQMEKLNELRLKYGSHLSDGTIAAIHSVASSKAIDYQLIGSLVAYIVERHERAGILIFLPGVNEIRQCMNVLQSRLSAEIAEIFPLHANLSIEEQNRIFKQSMKWKIIAATNVAETSITINDIIYVIDSGRVKETRYIPETDLTRLEEVLVTRAAARQRRGRAGRMQPGVCYKLYTKHTEKTVMEEYPKPEILRVPLEQVSLSAKIMNDVGDVKDLLQQVIDPPDSRTVDRAWQSLQELGAIDSQDQLTPLGRHMAMLPLDVRLAKILILGTIFQCLNPALSIAALLSSKPLFSSPMEKREEASRSVVQLCVSLKNLADGLTRTRKKFALENSDLLTDLEAFNQCQKLRTQGKNPNSFCKENFISVTTVQEVFTLRRELCAALEESGFIPPQCDPTDSAMNVNSDNPNLLKAVVLGGLWPRIARVHLPKSAIKFDKVQAGTVQRDNTANEFKMYDLREGRVFIHPGSVLFQCAAWKSPFLVYFRKYQSSKIFLRDATEVPMYALLLFGGPVAVDHVKGGITIGSSDSFIKLKAWPRIGVLVNQLRQLLDLLLTNTIEDASKLGETQNHPVVQAMLSLLVRDGMTE